MAGTGPGSGGAGGGSAGGSGAEGGGGRGRLEVHVSSGALPIVGKHPECAAVRCKTSALSLSPPQAQVCTGLAEGAASAQPRFQRVPGNSTLGKVLAG